ncbi:serum amyloid P-component-like [Stegastes partitus]|uniref:Pentraxin family member n=1 Tax=Stegastes partitus TaxID=144197 RepID=A0A3B4ZP47_9TELE|nr:PREDICTED: serum amyloid P-component-like [Stegastes partitus]
MKLFVVLVMLSACAANPEDLSGKMLTFPVESNTANARLTAAKEDFSAITVCHRTFTDLNRDHALFSMAVSSSSNAFLIFWDATNKEMEPHVRDTKAEYRGFDYKPNMWHSICTTWDSQTGFVQMWFDGQPSIKKYVSAVSNIRGTPIIILGQEQDSYGGGFHDKQSFVGMVSDVHMWDYALSSCEIQRYFNELNFTPGNVLNWGAMEFTKTDKVIKEEKIVWCH